MKRLLALACVLGSLASFAAPDARAQDLQVGMRSGQVMPDIELPLIDGSRSLRLSELRGKKVLLVSFASW